MATEVDVTGVAVPRFSRAAIAAFVRAALRAAGAHERRARSISSASVHFTDDKAMKALNTRFRGKNRTTDVLTFPADRAMPAEEGVALGEIVISVEQARRQAATERHSLATEVRYLLLHGVIHALGYDHESDQGEMNALEVKLRRRVGL